MNCVDLKNFIMGLKIIFTWWNRQTFGTFKNLIFLESLLVPMNMEINTIKVRKMKDGLFMVKILRTKISADWCYGCIIQLTKYLIIKIKNFHGKKNI